MPPGGDAPVRGGGERGSPRLGPPPSGGAARAVPGAGPWASAGARALQPPAQAPPGGARPPWGPPGFGTDTAGQPRPTTWLWTAPAPGSPL